MNLDFFGNKLAEQRLRNTIQDGNLSHAYLIYGENGLGKKTFAKRFAMSVLCKGEPKPCFQCSACKKIELDVHPDVKLYLGGEAKDAVHIELIRDIRSDCAIKPNESMVKIYILTNVQNMTNGAFNAFLKTLEEPPKNTLFLLTAPNMDMLPSTVISRLSPIQLFPLTDAEVEQALQARFADLSQKQLHSIAQISRGNLGQAIKQVEDPDFLKMQEDLTLLCRCLVSKREYPLLKLLSTYEKDKQKLMILFDRLNRALASALFSKLHVQQDATASVVASDNSLNIVLSAGLSKQQMINLIGFFEEAKRKLSTNANMNLLLAYFAVEMKRLVDHKDRI